jgi:hypothetical protein
MIESTFNYQFGEEKEHLGSFSGEGGLLAEYSVNDFCNHIRISYSAISSGTTVIDIERRLLFRPKVFVDGRTEGRIITRLFRFDNPRWKIAYEFRNKMFYLYVESGPDKPLSFKLSDWRNAFKKEFKIAVKSDNGIVGTISGPAWTLEVDRKLKIEIMDECNLIPFFVLTFLSLSESNTNGSGGG